MSKLAEKSATAQTGHALISSILSNIQKRQIFINNGSFSIEIILENKKTPHLTRTSRTPPQPQSSRSTKKQNNDDYHSLPQLLQCHCLLTFPTANTPHNATLPTFDRPDIFLVFFE